MRAEPAARVLFRTFGGYQSVKLGSAQSSVYPTPKFATGPSGACPPLCRPAASGNRDAVHDYARDAAPDRRRRSRPRPAIAVPSNITEPGSGIEAGKVPETSVSRTFPETARTEKESIGLKVIKQVSAAGPAEHPGLTPPVNVPIRMPALVKRLKLSPVCTEPTTTSSISPRSTETKTLVPAPMAQSGSEQAAGGPSAFSPIPLSWSGLPGGSSGAPDNGFSVMALSSIPPPGPKPCTVKVDVNALSLKVVPLAQT